MPGGRPSIYEAGFVEKVYNYIKDFAMYGDEAPWMEGLTEILGCSVASLNVWQHEYPEFLAACEDLKKAQKRVLLNKGLQGKINAPITIRALAANHGMSEKSEEKHEHSGGITVITKVPDAGGDPV